jgi:hypothetical protein
VAVPRLQLGRWCFFSLADAPRVADRQMHALLHIKQIIHDSSQVFSAAFTALQEPHSASISTRIACNSVSSSPSSINYHLSISKIDIPNEVIARRFREESKPHQSRLLQLDSKCNNLGGKRSRRGQSSITAPVGVKALIRDISPSPSAQQAQRSRDQRLGTGTASSSAVSVPMPCPISLIFTVV